MAKEKKSFILYVDQGEQVGMLSDSEAGRLFKALFCFAGEGKNAYFGDGMTQMCFSFMSAQITRDQEAYREKCAKLSENAKRRKQLHAIEGDTDTVTDTATVTDTVTETETDTVTVTGTVTGTVSGTDTCPGAHAHTHAHGRERAHACDALVVAPQEAPPPPAPRSAPQSAPQKNEEEISFLVFKGIPSDYVEERLDRATDYAKEHQTTVGKVIEDWWANDRSRPPWNHPNHLPAPHNAAPPPLPLLPSFHTDDFFESALRKAFRQLPPHDSS